MKKNFVIKALALFIVAFMLLAGCGPAADNTSSDAGNTDGTQSSGGSTATDIMSIEMPTRDLSNNDKVLTMYTWTSLEENYFDGEAIKYFQQEFGVKIEPTISTHEAYWTDYAKMVAAGNAPDIIDLEYSSFWPLPVSNSLFQTWEGHIDFSTPLWADVQHLLERYKWKDKIYYPAFGEFVAGWFFYNKATFQNYGLESDTPLELYKRDEWTLDKLVELSDTFIEKNNKNEIVHWGFGQQEYEVFHISGIQPFEVKNGTEYKNNLGDAKIAKVMNAMNKMSKGLGSGSWTAADISPAFLNETVGMMFNYSNILTNASYADFIADDILGLAPYPKLDENSKYNIQMVVDPGYGLSNVQGANTELAALFIEYLKWFKLGENVCREVPTTQNNPAKQKYNLKQVIGSVSLSEEMVNTINSILDAENTDIVYNDYQSIIRHASDFDLFKYSIFSGEAAWSTVLQQLNPRYEAILKDYIK